MSTMQSASSTEATGFKGWVIRHPLIAYFVLAYALTWVFVIPILLSQRGLNLVTLPDELLLILFLVSTFSGPTPAALIVTRLTEGKEGVSKLLKGMLQWRVGFQWILIALIGYPVIFLIGLLVTLGTGPLMTLLGNPLVLLTGYLPAALIGIIYPSLGEEPGWRGFALPRLQKDRGPLAGSLILGTLHALWHLPAYGIVGAISETGWDTTVFVANSLAIIASTFIWTWLFNSGKGSILFAMFVHGVSNANSALIGGLVPEGAPDAPFFAFGVMAAAAALVIAITRGNLAYKPVNELIG